ncbi:hypothetical protein ADIARSV_0837 [Arcticibacter svalbardensis MN12-7]|uniref:Uncharacterized protein n=1 Tax=Arcticibacter svalbardensis MN12-7 TaxID=1150600 RepID=R9GVS7_9SPHI|nr:hypothetical protein ADIARSV_0837 [Arcticibacter svalbardensis MN12-7]
MAIYVPNIITFFIYSESFNLNGLSIAAYILKYCCPVKEKRLAQAPTS